MKHQPPFSYSSDGRLMVGADGDEIVFYDGVTEGPLYLVKNAEEVLWIFAADDGVIAVGATTTSVFEEDGELAHTLDHPDRFRNPTAAAFNPLFSEVALVSEHGVHRFDVWDEENYTCRVADATDVALGYSGESLVLSADGSVRLFDDDGNIEEVFKPPTRFKTVAAMDFAWFLANDREVYTLDGDVFDLLLSVEGREIDEIYTNEQGNLLGIRSGSTVTIHETENGSKLAEIIYGDRVVGPVCFGLFDWIAIGLDSADGNKVSLTSGALHRTDTHPARPHNSWICSVSVDQVAAQDWLDASFIADDFSEPSGGEWADSVDPADQQNNIESFHDSLTGEVGERLGFLIRNGPLPNDKDDCIYAVNRTIPLLEGQSVDEEPGQSARIRLRALRRLLEQKDQTPDVVRTIHQIDETIALAEKKTRSDIALGCGCLVAIALVVLLGIVFVLI